MAQHRVASQRFAQCLAGVDTGLSCYPIAVYLGDRTQCVDTDDRDDQVAVVSALACPEQGCRLFVERLAGQQTGDRFDIGLQALGGADRGHRPAGEGDDDGEHDQWRDNGERGRDVIDGDPGRQPRDGQCGDDPAECQ